MCICCVPSSNLPGLKTDLPHLLTKPWLEDRVPVLRLGRSEDGAGGRKMGQANQNISFTQTTKELIVKYVHKEKVKINIINVQQQENDSDCGVFAIAFAMVWSEDGADRS